MTEKPQKLRPQGDFVELRTPSDSGVLLFDHLKTEGKKGGESYKEILTLVYFCEAKWVKVDSWANLGNTSKSTEKSFGIGASDSMLNKISKETGLTGMGIKNISVLFGTETKKFDSDESSGGTATASHRVGAGETVPVYQREYKLKYTVQTTVEKHHTRLLGLSEQSSGSRETDEHDATIKSNEFRYDHPPLTGARKVEVWPKKRVHESK